MYKIVSEIYGLQYKYEDIVLYGQYIDIERQKEIKNDMARFCGLTKQIVNNTGAYNLFIRRVAEELNEQIQKTHFNKSNCDKQTHDGQVLYTIPYVFLSNIVVRVMLIGDYIERNYDTVAKE